MDRIGNNPIMFVRITHFAGDECPTVEFQRVYSSNWYRLDTGLDLHRIQQILNEFSNELDRFVHFVHEDGLTVSLAL